MPLSTAKGAIEERNAKPRVRSTKRKRDAGRLVLGLVVFSTLGCAARDAGATPTFPERLRVRVAAPAAPSCAICHGGGVTGRGTVTTLFGSALRARGVLAHDESSLDRAFDALRGERHDADSDGVPDAEELERGEDPNVRSNGGPDAGSYPGIDGGAAAPDGSAPIVPVYGCGAHVAPREEATRGGWFSCALALLVFGALRRAGLCARRDGVRGAERTLQSGA